MKWVAYARNQVELQLLKEAGASEVLLSHSQLSRLGNLNSLELNDLAKMAKSLDIRPILEWDILMTSQEFSRSVKTLDELAWESLSAVRVQDPGAFEFILKERVTLPIQLVLETGNRNLESIQRWIKYGMDSGKGRVERVVVSIELPQARIAQIISELTVEVEILGLGPILLLYTPRHLLSNQRNDFEWMANQDEFARHQIQSIASSEQTLHAGFRVVENQHGTLLFHAKDYCLLDQIHELRESHLAAVRVDYRLEQCPTSFRNLRDLFQDPSELRSQQFIESHSRKVTRCFFKANATDVLFKKLKNTEIQRRDLDYVGDVVEISRGQYTIIHVLSQKLSLTRGQKLKIITPDGQNLECQIQTLTDLDQRPLEKIISGEFGLIQYVKRATPGASVYLNHEESMSGNE